MGKEVRAARVLREDQAYAVGRRIYRYSPLDPVGAEELPLPAVASLEASAPNPIRASTEIAFSLPWASTARIDVFDVTGRLVTTLHDGPLGRGAHRVTWDGADARGRSVPAGVYFYRLEADGVREARKMQRLR